MCRFDHCYTTRLYNRFNHSTDEESWDDAEKYCNSINSHLLSINSGEEQRDIVHWLTTDVIESHISATWQILRSSLIYIGFRYSQVGYQLTDVCQTIDLTINIGGLVLEKPQL